MNYVLFGTGSFAKKILENIVIENVLCFIDNNRCESNKTMYGKPVLSLEEFLQEDSFKGKKIYIASSAYKDIVNQLMQYGFSETVDFEDGVNLLSAHQVRQLYSIDSNIEDDFIEIFKKCKNYTMTNWARMYSLYKSVEYIVKNDIFGDIVECGVWRGGSALVVAETLVLLEDYKRDIYLFDTYKGMTEPTLGVDVDNYGEEAHLLWKQRSAGGHNDWCYASVEDVKKNMSLSGYPSDKLHFVIGDVLETVPDSGIHSIAILRLDTDWYESTKIELEVLYPKLSKSGVLILDDYGDWLGAKKAVDEYFIGEKTFPLLQRIDHGARIHIK